MSNVKTGGAPSKESRPSVRKEAARNPGDEAKAPALSIKAVFARFWPYARPYRWRLALALGLGVALPALQAVTIWMFKVLTDKVLVPRDLGAFWPVAAAYAGITVAVGAVSFSSSYLSRWLAQHFALDLRTDLFAHLHQLSLDVLDNRRLGDVLSRITSDVTAVRRLVVTGVTRSLGNALRVVIFTVALFILQWRLAIVALAAAPLFALAARAFATRIRAASREARHRSGAMTAIAEESLGNAPLVQAYQQQDGEVRRFHGEGLRKMAAQLRSAWLSAAFGPLVQVLELAGVLAVIGLGTWQMAEGNLSLGGLLAFVGFVTQLYSPIRSLSRLSNTVFSASAGAERISELMSMKSSVPEAPYARDLGRATGRVRFDTVDFAYPATGRTVVHGLSFTAEPGRVLGIEGPSGAGKTTIAKLTARLYDVTSGAVTVDGNDVRDLAIGSLRENLSLLLQETLVFHGTIFDNIAYGRTDATTRDVYAAAEAAEVDDFVRDLPNGYDTVIGERGRSLSGGQRQRIAIARALVRDAPILILDEPATGLDDETGDRVLTALRRVMAGRTTIIIAHDAQSLALADDTLHIDAGRLTPVAESARAPDPSTTPDNELVPGYLLQKRLSRGEALDVHEAWSVERSCPCVVKTLRPDRRESSRDAEQLRREGRLLTGYTHPHLVRGYEVIESERIGPVVVMETLTGATVSKLITDEWPLDDDDVAILGRQLVSVLRYLHADGLLHLDLKPSNIVCDAGIARLIDLSLARPAGTHGITAGTYEYKAPEQMNGERLTAATDVWGLSGVLFRAITGHRPFPRGTGIDGMVRASDDLPDLDLLTARDIDPRLCRIVRDCFSPDPRNRPTLDEVDAALASVVADAGGSRKEPDAASRLVQPAAGVR